MGAPLAPSDFKKLIPSAAGSFCQKFLNVLQLPYLVWQWVSWMLDESTEFSQDFKDMICKACANSGGGNGQQNPAMPSPTGVQASDGTYSDKIEVTWDPVIPTTGGAPTLFTIYRAASTVLDPTAATVVGTVDGATFLFDDPVDADLVQGEKYNYWIKASNSAAISGFSMVDVGNAGTISTTLPAVTTLACTKGFSVNFSPQISLVWTPVGGVTKWDIYRHTVNDPLTATKIAADQIPKTNDGNFTIPPNQCWDNLGEVLYQDPIPPAAGATVFYYWVVGKKDSPPSESPKSNVDTGWVNTSAGFGSNDEPVERAGADLTIASGIAKIRFVLFGGGAGGGGGGAIYGSGGGGGGGIAIGEKAVVAGAKLRINSTPNTDQTSQAAGPTSGDNGFVVKLQYSANGLYTDTIDLATTVAPTGGVYSSAGGGAGGSGGGASVHASVANSSIISGRAGQAGNGGAGGMSGYMFGRFRLPMSNPFGPNDSFSGDSGSGSRHADGNFNTADYKGGYGSTGWAAIGY